MFPSMIDLNPPALCHLTPHHIGVATQSIASELPIFTALGFEIEGEFIDEIQGIRGLFITSKATDSKVYRLELLENLPQSTKLDGYLKNHHKLYHIAFISHDIESDSKAILNYRFQNMDSAKGGGNIKYSKARMLVPITKASYFSKLCFIMLPNRLLIELIELHG